MFVGLRQVCVTYSIYAWLVSSLVQPHNKSIPPRGRVLNEFKQTCANVRMDERTTTLLQLQCPFKNAETLSRYNQH